MVSDSASVVTPKEGAPGCLDALQLSLYPGRWESQPRETQTNNMAEKPQKVQAPLNIKSLKDSSKPEMW